MDGLVNLAASRKGSPLPFMAVPLVLQACSPQQAAMADNQQESTFNRLLQRQSPFGLLANFRARRAGAAEVATAHQQNFDRCRMYAFADRSVTQNLDTGHTFTLVVQLLDLVTSDGAWDSCTHLPIIALPSHILITWIALSGVKPLSIVPAFQRHIISSKLAVKVNT
eukprot:143857-Amphidinium_carterae.3